MIEIECSLARCCSSKCSEKCLNCEHNDKEDYFDYYTPKKQENEQ